MMPTVVKCAGCGVTFSPEPRPGRQLQYHSTACKQAAWRRRTGRTGHEARISKGRNAMLAAELEERVGLYRRIVGEDPRPGDSAVIDDLQARLRVSPSVP